MERDYWLGFSSFSGIGLMKFKKLINKFGSAKDAWKVPKSDLAKLLGEKLTEKFDRFRNQFSLTEYLKKLTGKDVWYLTLQDEDYPKALAQIRNPPFVLYGIGQIPDGIWSLQSIAVVGARRTTQYGREVTKLLTADLVANGFTIVSGLAIGVDAISHMTCLENRGKTIAVLGCGVDCCFPRENQSLYNSIIRSGNCIVSEFPLGMAPTKWTFPARNRIIAGLSCAVLVTEGTEDSGSLITADYCLKFGRKVFAVPGPITSSMSKGPYKLIQKGARLVTSAKDILDELKISNSKSQIANKSQITKFKISTKEERKILDLLQNEALHFDEIVRRVRLSSSKIGSILSLMEIRGLVKGLGSGQFSIAS